MLEYTPHPREIRTGDLPTTALANSSKSSFGIPSCHIAEDTHIKHADVVMDAGAESGSGDKSGWSGVSDNSSTDSECTNLEASSVASV